MLHSIGWIKSANNKPMQAAKSILLIEDEHDIAQLISLHLNDAGLEVCHVARGDTGLETARSSKFDALILDLRLPGLSGLEVCRQLRANNANLPILMLTAKSTELDRVLGLELGADDYVTKPFSAIELTARVKALLRRSGSYQRSQKGRITEGFVECGQLLIDVDKHQVRLHGEAIELTAKEFDLLLFFARQPSRVFRRAELLDQVWGYGHEGYEHTVNSHINRLRAKIEKQPTQPQYITTVWGVGYKLNRDALV